MSDHQRILTLVRGEQAYNHISCDRLRQILDDTLTNQDQKVADIWERLDDSRFFQNFSDMAYSVTFMVTKPIGVTSLGFFGPHDLSSAKYRLKLRVYQMTSTWRSPRDIRTELASAEATFVAVQNTIFYVNFARPLPCPEKAWIRIEFMLNGPPTSVCRKVWHSYETPEGVKFDFYSSSKQIPEIKYVLMDGDR